MRLIERPQPGPQWQAAKCTADILVYGGQAGSGKSAFELLEAARNIDHPNYNGIIFRRTYPELVAGGGLWDTAGQIYPRLGGVGKFGEMRYDFPSGAYIKFSHMQHEKDRLSHYGAAYCYEAFDELVTFTKKQFFFLLTRNRPPAGYDRPCYVRTTTNPDADSWVAELISWWWDPETGYPIKDRAGVLRYFTVDNEEVIWVDKDWLSPEGIGPRSITFIPGSVDDNPALLEADPRYKSSLYAQDLVTRERLLKGNWRITYTGGMFRPDWFDIVDDYPKGMKEARYWDFAATEEDPDKDPDCTASAMGGMWNGDFYILDVTNERETPAKTEARMKRCAEVDGHDCAIAWEEEKGSSGKFVSSHLVAMLAGYETRPDPVTGDKIERAKPWCALAEHGHVKLLRGEWNRQFLAQAGSFPTKKKDMIDACSGLYKTLTTANRVWPGYRSLYYDDWPIAWDDLEAGKVCVYVVLVADADLRVYGNCFLWGRKSRKVYVYDELIHPSPVADVLAGDIIDRVRVPLKASNVTTVGVTRMFGNDEMFGDGWSMPKMLRKYGIRLHQNRKYDEAGSILLANQLIVNCQVLVCANCVETDRQYRTWGIADGRPERGYQLCRALAIVSSVLRDEGELQEKAPEKPYSSEASNIRQSRKQKNYVG